MKKQLSYIRNEKAFIFPFVLFAISLFLLALHHHLHMYKNDIIMTELFLDQIKIETIYQMARTEVKKELAKNDKLETLSFHYPYGRANVVIEQISAHRYQVKFDITTIENNSTYTFVSEIQVK